jgi:hypothetical protein
MGLHTRNGLRRDGGKRTQPVRNKRSAAAETRRDLDANKQQQQRYLFASHPKKKKQRLSDIFPLSLAFCLFCCNKIISSWLMSINL